MDNSVGSSWLEFSFHPCKGLSGTYTLLLLPNNSFATTVSYTIFLYDTMFPSTFLSVPHIPNPFNAIPAVTPAPEVSAATSILSLFGSIFTFARGCRLTAMQIIWSSPPPNRGFSKINILTAAPAACLGLIAPAIALYGGVPWLEFGFWSIPFLVLGMMTFAIHMMIQVENNIDDLDKARYKYKGA